MSNSNKDYNFNRCRIGSFSENEDAFRDWKGKVIEEIECRSRLKTDDNGVLKQDLETRIMKDIVKANGRINDTECKVSVYHNIDIKSHLFQFACDV